MRFEQRRKDALNAASSYAPAPQASRTMYGSIGISLFGVGAWSASRFYGLPLSPHLALLGICAVVSFLMGLWLWRKRKRRHVRAYRAELDQRQAADVDLEQKAG